MRIGIVIPTQDMIHTDTAMCLFNMMQYTIGPTKDYRFGHLPIPELALINPRSSLVQKARWSGVHEAIRMGADKILFIDSDQTFPADALLRLVSNCTGHSILGVASVTRRPPIQYTARDMAGNKIDFRNKSGIHKVSSNGFSFCLINVEVFKDVTVSKWFEVYQDSNGRWHSEDENFCERAMDAGYHTWVDATLTKEIGHIGQKIYTHNDMG